MKKKLSRDDWMGLFVIIMTVISLAIMLVLSK